MKKERRTFEIQMPVSHSVCTPLSEFFPYYGVFSIEKQKSTVAHCIVDYRNTWRRVWDSNPRGREPKRFSRPPRYDHFDNSPY